MSVPARHLESTWKALDELALLFEQGKALGVAVALIGGYTTAETRQVALFLDAIAERIEGQGLPKRLEPKLYLAPSSAAGFRWEFPAGPLNPTAIALPAGMNFWQLQPPQKSSLTWTKVWAVITNQSPENVMASGARSAQHSIETGAVTIVSVGPHERTRDEPDTVRCPRQNLRGNPYSEPPCDAWYIVDGNGNWGAQKYASWRSARDAALRGRR